MPIFFANYKVYINHTDAGGIVYHANHLTFFENCRRDWLSSLGFDGYFFNQAGAAQQGASAQAGKVHFVVSRADLVYKLPLLVDDVLVVTVHDMVKKSASLILTQHIYRSKADFDQGLIASTGLITLACVEHTAHGLRPCRLPATLRASA